MSQSYESFGKYILLEKIQQGGMAEIYLARKPGASGVSKFVAIKRILSQFSEQSDYIEMFKKEAKIAVNLAHSNIVTIHEFGIEHGQFFIAMDYVEGRNLRQIQQKMKKSGVNFTIEQVLFIVKQVAEGLDHAHRCLDANTGKPLNITHRDISPQNIMASFEGEVKIVDFGIAKDESNNVDTTRAGTLKGKFSYMSPEQAEGQHVDLRTDVFALGIVLWEMLANDRLFVGSNEAVTLRKVRDCQIPSLRKINPSIPQELESIVSKALAKDRNLRYPTAAQFARDLSKFLNRKYPDFSPHDFSIFVKTLYATEIAENRKKMIEYSKVEGQVRAAVEVPPPRKQVEEPNTNSRTMMDESDSNPNFGTAHKNEPAVRPTTSRTVPHPPTPAPTLQNGNGVRARANVPTFSGTPADINTSGLAIDRNPLREGTYAGSESSYTGSYSSRKSGIRVRKGRNFSSMMGPLVIIGALIVGAILLPAGKIEEIKQVIAGTFKGPKDPGPQRTEQASTVPKYKLSVTTTPSGANLIIDGKPVEITPATIEIEQNKEVSVSIQKAGYVTRTNVLKMVQGIQLDVTLDEEQIGRLDITVRGTGRIFVDGKPISDGSPAFNVPVAANKEIVVIAEDPITKARDERRVRVAPNARLNVELIPRAPRPAGL